MFFFTLYKYIMKMKSRRRQRGGKVSRHPTLGKILSIGYEIESTYGFFCRMEQDASDPYKFILFPLEHAVNIPATVPDDSTLELRKDSWYGSEEKEKFSLQNLYETIKSDISAADEPEEIRIQFSAEDEKIYELRTIECIRHIEFHKTFTREFFASQMKILSWMV